MWLAGGVDREKWFNHRFAPGQLVECGIRDNEGHAQGTVILEIAAALSTDDQGHWVTAKFLGASDAHMQWWMSEGAGKKLAAKCAYHFCEDSSHDCKVSRRGASIHVEKFRVLGQKEVNNHVPSWAFAKSMGKHFMDFLKKKGMEPKAEEAKGALPWVDPGEEASEEEEEESSGSREKEGLKSKLLKARDMVKRLERELSGKKKASKSGGIKAKKEKVKRKKKVEPDAEVKKKRKKEKKSPSPGGGKKKKRKAAGADEERDKEARVAKKKKKDIEESSSYSEEEEGLFGEGTEGKASSSAKKGQRDRGPFGGGDIVRYQGESSSESEAVFREAPTVPKASNQLKLMQYAKRTPGRLASRLLLKMQVEGAQGAVGANPADRGELTPPAAVHYFHTTIVPQLGQRLGMRAHREMRALRTALDMLARKLPAHAADLLGQRLKAIEKSCHDGHWQAAQFLELLGPDAGGLLERDEEVFMNREHLLELKLKGFSNPRAGKDGKGSQEKGGRKGKERGKGKGGEREKEKKD